MDKRFFGSFFSKKELLASFRLPTPKRPGMIAPRRQGKRNNA
jgi:hypothetical protein